MVKSLLRIEALVFLLFSLVIYNYFGGSWVILIVLFFTPDVSLIGYFKDKKTGAIIYNIVHNYILAIILMLSGFLLFKNVLIMQFGVILFAHVSLDRFLGFGLKYQYDFKSTHIQKT